MITHSPAKTSLPSTYTRVGEALAGNLTVVADAPIIAPLISVIQIKNIANARRIPRLLFSCFIVCSPFLQILGAIPPPFYCINSFFPFQPTHSAASGRFWRGKIFLEGERCFRESTSPPPHHPLSPKLLKRQRTGCESLNAAHILFFVQTLRV